MKPPADILLKNRDGSDHGLRPAGAAAHRTRPLDPPRPQVVVAWRRPWRRPRTPPSGWRWTMKRLKPSRVIATRAAESSAPRLYDVGNVCIDVDVGDIEATKAASRAPPRVAKLDTWVHRVTGVPDARAAVGVYYLADEKIHAACRIGRRGAAEGRAGQNPRRRAQSSCASNAATSAAISDKKCVFSRVRAGGRGAAKRLGRPVSLDLRAFGGLCQRLSGPRPGHPG